MNNIDSTRSPRQHKHLSCMSWLRNETPSDHLNIVHFIRSSLVVSSPSPCQYKHLSLIGLYQNGRTSAHLIIVHLINKSGKASQYIPYLATPSSATQTPQLQFLSEWKWKCSPYYCPFHHHNHNASQ